MTPTRLIQRTAWAASVVSVLIQSNVHAQALDPWLTVDDFQLGPGLKSRAYSIGTDADGAGVFCVGTASVDANNVGPAIMRHSTDGGSSWTSVDAFALPGDTQANNQAFAANPVSGALYVGGFARSGQLTPWIVRRSEDGGANWSVADTYQLNPNGSAACLGIGFGVNGATYAVGQAMDPAGLLGAWVVRRNLNDGATWLTVDSRPGGRDPAPGGAMAVTGHPNGSVFVVGSLPAGGGGKSKAWTVRRSQDGGDTWATVDSYWPGKTDSQAQAIAVDSFGTLYVAGFNSTASGWVVRRSVNAGATWSNADALPGSATGLVTVPRDDQQPDDVYVCGWYFDRTGIQHWRVRKSIAGGPWSTSDDFLGASRANPAAITSDFQGGIYVTGYMVVPSLGPRWVTRRLAWP